MLNLGHTPLYRHFCKCRYIEMLKILLVYLLFSYFFSPLQSSSMLALLMTYRKSFIHFTHMWFSATLGIAQTSLALLSLARKFFAQQCQWGILSFECWMLSYSRLRPAIVNWSIVNWSLRQCWVLSVDCWIVGFADVELCAMRNVECWMVAVGNFEFWITN